MKGADVVALRDQLSARDIAILESLRAHRLATTTQIRRLHFDEHAISVEAARRATARVLLRLEGHRLVSRLAQRIGGVRRGSDGLTWQLASRGDRLLAVMRGADKRRRYIETGTAFAQHTIGVTDLAIELQLAVRAGDLEQVTVETEPRCWRHFTGAHAAKEILKPDLYVKTAMGEFEDHWWIEFDLETEHPSTVTKKARVYLRYAANGAQQRATGVFPVALWVVPTQARQDALQRAFRQMRDISPGMFRVTTRSAFMATILAGADPAAGP